MKKLVAMVFVVLTVSAHLLADEIVYKIGEEGPGGGIVFYYSKAGFPVKDPLSLSPKICHYLECSPVDLGCMSWCPQEKIEYNKYKECCNVQTSNARQDGVGAGFANTVNILKAEHKCGELTATNCAAKACSVYFTGTTKPGEWYLPSALELELIKDNLVRTGIILDKERSYWSSSQTLYEDSNGNFPDAYYIIFNDKVVEPFIKADGKDARIYVRAVRAF